MVVVCAILTLLATLIMPNLVALRRSQDLRQTAAAILRLPIEARNQAAALKVPVVLHFDGNDLVLEQADVTTVQSGPLTMNRPPNASRTPLGASAGAAANGNGTTILKRVTLGSEVQIESAQDAGESQDPGSWQWMVYPDGTADTAGLVFRFGSEQRSLYLPADGAARWIEGGNLPDPTQDHWPAGEVEQRATTG